MAKKFIDTSIFLRYLTRYDPAKYEKCRELFKKAIEGKTSVSTSGMVNLLKRLLFNDNII